MPEGSAGSYLQEEPRSLVGRISPKEGRGVQARSKGNGSLSEGRSSLRFTRSMWLLFPLGPHCTQRSGPTSQEEECLLSIIVKYRSGSMALWPVTADNPGEGCGEFLALAGRQLARVQHLRAGNTIRIGHLGSPWPCCHLGSPWPRCLSERQGPLPPGCWIGERQPDS